MFLLLPPLSLYLSLSPIRQTSAAQYAVGFAALRRLCMYSHFQKQNLIWPDQDRFLFLPFLVPRLAANPRRTHTRTHAHTHTHTPQGQPARCLFSAFPPIPMEEEALLGSPPPRRELFNVVVLGLSFLLIMASFQTSSFFQVRRPRPQRLPMLRRAAHRPLLGRRCACLAQAALRLAFACALASAREKGEREEDRKRKSERERENVCVCVSTTTARYTCGKEEGQKPGWQGCASGRPLGRRPPPHRHSGNPTCRERCRPTRPRAHPRPPACTAFRAGSSRTRDTRTSG